MSAHDWPAALARAEAEVSGDDRLHHLRAASIALYRAESCGRIGPLTYQFVATAARELREAGADALAAEAERLIADFMMPSFDALRERMDALLEEMRG